VAGGATRLRLRVVPGSKSPGVVGRHGDAWKLRVAAPPETLRISPDDVRLVAGRGSRDKVVEVSRIAPSEAERRLSR